MGSMSDLDVSTRCRHRASAVETGAGDVCLHREREPSVEILERREVWLAAELQQGVGFRHSLQVVRDEEGEGRRCVCGERA